MGKKRPPSESSSSGSYGSDEYSDSGVSTSMSKSASTSVSKPSKVSKVSKVSKAKTAKSSAISSASTKISKGGKSTAYSTATSVKSKKSATSYAPSAPPETSSPDHSVVALSNAPPSVFEENAKEDKRTDVASTVASSALPVKDAPQISNWDRAEGGGWSIWNGIISQKISEKNSVPGYLKRAMYAAKDSYIAILVGMVVVLVTLVTLRPSFVLGANVSRYEDPPLDMMRVGVFTIVFGVISFVAIQSVAK
ncbi:hypothetical protein EPVG_00238 [Emiliania huxleyi virus 201]|nr:hypothetical protein ELVG_00063 [Emiliania huxleyi virus 203]AEP15470.1 hypothetical protein EQVG_00060 [Emiliania huxleyi virus 207]AEP15894.1 hypothetical protein ERVG_00016 [Emiliania huxleyi virus 208]AET98125.1 hypothetical protein EPVG_00238 [Emiliania huxleyi virus 201]